MLPPIPTERCSIGRTNSSRMVRIVSKQRLYFGSAEKPCEAGRKTRLYPLRPFQLRRCSTRGTTTPLTGADDEAFDFSGHREPHARNTRPCNSKATGVVSAPRSETAVVGRCDRTAGACSAAMCAEEVSADASRLMGELATQMNKVDTVSTRIAITLFKKKPPRQPSAAEGALTVPIGPRDKSSDHRGMDRSKGKAGCCLLHK